MRSRKWLITLFKYVEDKDSGELINTNPNNTIETLQIRYELAYIKHDKENNDNPHFHIYIRSNNAIRFETLKNVNKYMHIEVAYGNDKQIHDYMLHRDIKSQMQEKQKYDENEILGNLIFNEIEDLKENLIQDIISGLSTYEIILNNPKYLFKVKEIKMLVEERKQYEYNNNIRSLHNTDNNNQ